MIQLVVLEAVCDWCLASEAITAVLAPVALLRVPGGDTVAAQPSSSPSDSA